MLLGLIIRGICNFYQRGRISSLGVSPANKLSNPLWIKIHAPIWSRTAQCGDNPVNIGVNLIFSILLNYLPLIELILRACQLLLLSHERPAHFVFGMRANRARQGADSRAQLGI